MPYKITTGYKLTTVTDICNAGCNATVTRFNDLYELQDFVEEATAGMSEEDQELFYYNSTIKTITKEVK